MGQSPSSQRHQFDADIDEEASSAGALCHWSPRTFGFCGSSSCPSLFSRRRRDILLCENSCENHQDELKERSRPAPRHRQYTIQSLPFAPAPADTLVSKLVAVDCGMVRVGPRLPKSERRHQPLALRRVCIVDGRGDILLKETVRVPPNQNTEFEFQTKFARQISAHVLPRVNNSGDDLNKGVSPDEVKRSAADLIRGKIVVGHSVGGDLSALDVSHPKEYLRDSALYPPFLNKKGGSHKLIYLAKERLGRSIQKEGMYHGCEEDAVASLDLYLSSWDEWEAMAACSSLPHTHTSQCNLRGRLPKEISATVPQCQSLSSEQSTVGSTSDSAGNNSNKQDEKKRKRSESRRRRKQRRKERNRNVELVAEHQAVLSAAVGDILKLVIEGPRRIWRYFASSWGYQMTVPEPFVRTRESRKRWKERQRRFQRRRRRLCYLLVWIRSAVLVSHVIIEPLAICLRYQAQLLGIVITQRGIDVAESGVFNQLGFVSSLLGSSLFAATDRCSVQSRISLGILVYYHTLYLSHCTQDLRGLSLSVDGSYAYLALYHVGFFLYFPIDLACKRLGCAKS